MKIKTKLRLGIGLLFLMILVLSGVGVKNINALKKDTGKIQADNYNTLEYCKNMNAALDSILQTGEGLAIFEKNLDLQKNNITEPGEGLPTNDISIQLANLNASPRNMDVHLLIRKDLSRIMDLNMAAIKHKSDIAKITAETANKWIVITSTLCFLLGMTLFINMPGNLIQEIIPGPNALKRT